ncbi:hypothetical protein [Thaumasiovibrio sp. DFM-14]|uniref:hypothetical protein n=1 Tax=Thaumasiovibrio sp. DFM-14 TaxID=3384792 RepID=UPI0039A29402
MVNVVYCEDTVAARKPYALTFKGLIAHVWDILFVRSEQKVMNVSALSEHMRKDLGL